MARFTWFSRSSGSKRVAPGLKTLAVIGALAVLLTAGQVHLQGRMVQAQTVATDRAALVALYDATGGGSWTDSAGWKTDQPLGDWHGVTTDSETGRVTSLIVANNNLTGALPAELGDLSELTELAFYDNQLTGSIPPELGNLSELVTLNLRNNDLTGLIPPELGKLNKMDGLHLNRNRLYGTVPSDLGNLDPIALGVLVFEDNQLIGELPHSFTRLTGLDDIRFGNNAGLCAPLDRDFRAWYDGVHTRQGPRCPPAAIRSGAGVAVVGEPVTARLTSRDARLARINATQQEYDNDPCVGYDISRNVDSPWSWERADANSSDPSLPDDNSWTPVSAGRHLLATFVYLPEAGDVGKFLRASVTYNGTAVTTEAIGPIATGNGLTPTDVVEVPAPTGTLRVGRTLRVSLPAAAAAEREERAINPHPEPWQWERSDDGGTDGTNVTPYHRHCSRPDSEYPLAAADAGKYLNAYVYYNDDSSGSSVLKGGGQPSVGPVAR